MPRVAVITGEHGEESLSVALGQSLEEEPIEGVSHYTANPLAVRLGVRHLGVVITPEFVDFPSLHELGLPKGCTQGANIALSYPGSLDSEVYEERCAAQCLEWVDKQKADIVIGFHQAPYTDNDTIWVFGRSTQDSISQTYHPVVSLASNISKGRVVYTSHWTKSLIAHRRHAVSADICGLPNDLITEGGITRTKLKELRLILGEMATDEPDYDSAIFPFTHVRTIRPGECEKFGFSPEYSGFGRVDGKLRAVTWGVEFLPAAVGELVYEEHSHFLI